MHRSWKALVAAAALAAGPALAHDSSGRALGTVERVEAGLIVVRTSDGHEVEFAVTEETRFTRGGKPARPQDVRTGQRAVVRGARTPAGLKALEVKLGDGR